MNNINWELFRKLPVFKYLIKIFDKELYWL